MRGKLKLAFVAAGTAIPGGAIATDYFGSGQATPPHSPGFTMPGLLQDIIGFVAQMQRALIDTLTARTAALESGATPGIVAAIVGVAFLYGVFHAAGPGHGKFVIATYLVTHKERFRRGVGMAVIMAGAQAVSAIVIVSVIALVLRAASGVVLDSVNILEAASYGLIILIGLGMAYRTVRGQPHHCAVHDHGDHHADRRKGWAARLLPDGPARNLAVAVGVRPCSGAIIILLFTLANGLFLVGIVATLVMAVGVAMTVSGIGLGAILARWGVSRLATNRPVTAAIAQRGVAMAGSLFLVVTGTLLLLGAVVRSGFAGW